jgi:hypothetical protein
MAHQPLADLSVFVDTAEVDLLEQWGRWMFTAGVTSRSWMGLVPSGLADLPSQEREMRAEELKSNGAVTTEEE